MATPSKELVEDLCTRFILTAPAEQHQSFEHLMFLVEEAHWYYEDTIRDRDRHLKSYTLNTFTKLIFEKCPELCHYVGSVEEILRKFKEYKRNVPAMGAIILDTNLERALLVKGVQSAACWGFPKGKINKDESEAHCAAREVFEETGFDIEPLLKEEDCISKEVSGKRMKLYIIPGVDHLTTEFHPKCKGEIGAYAWHVVNDLPSTYDEDKKTFVSMDGCRHKFFMVWPFVKPLKDWIAKRTGARRKGSPTAATAKAGCNSKTTNINSMANTTQPAGSNITDVMLKKALQDTLKTKAAGATEAASKRGKGGKTHTGTPVATVSTAHSGDKGKNLLATLEKALSPPPGVTAASNVPQQPLKVEAPATIADPAILMQQPAATGRSHTQQSSARSPSPAAAGAGDLPAVAFPKPVAWPPGLLIQAKHANADSHQEALGGSAKPQPAISADELEKRMMASQSAEKPADARLHLLTLLQRACSPPESPVDSPFTTSPGNDVLQLGRPMFTPPPATSPQPLLLQTTPSSKSNNLSASGNGQQILGWLQKSTTSQPSEPSAGKTTAPGHVLLGLLQRSASPLSVASSASSSTSLDTASASSTKSLADFSFNLSAIMVELQ